MGIAGSGMSALARILFDRVVPVSGCEARESWPGCERSAATSSSDSPRHLDDTDTFVFTTAITPLHGELVAARESGKLVLRRAAVLEDRRCVAVDGTHGRPRRPRCWWLRCRRAAWTGVSASCSPTSGPVLRQRSPRRTTRPISKR
jgi:hypothetical protein